MLLLGVGGVGWGLKKWNIYLPSKSKAKFKPQYHQKLTLI
jgi:hypothetical protein